MAFSDETVRQAWLDAGGKCECARASHGHGTRCNKTLIWANRGRNGFGAWEAHHRTTAQSGDDSLSNCEILCWPCHSKTF